MGGAPVAGEAGDVAGDDAGDLGAIGFGVDRVGAGVAEFGVGEGDDLAAVAGVGHHFLVAGHAGVEDDFADAGAGGAEGVTAIDGAVGEDEEGGLARGASRLEGHGVGWVGGVGPRSVYRWGAEMPPDRITWTAGWLGVGEGFGKGGDE